MTLQYRNLNHDDLCRATDTLSLSQIAQPVPPYAKPGFGLYRNVLKRVLDLAILALAAPVTVPFILLLALAVRIKTGASPFYSQPRVGKNGRIFTMLKLRTMIVDADHRLAAYLEANPDARVEWERDQKLKDDPRITSFGRLLRKTSIDELPQLWNVLVGEMSLVGPRPMMEKQKDLYPGLDYYDLRPGLTGSWQISKRNEASFAQRAWFDSEYNHRLSPAYDVSIILKTFSVILKGTGY